ncbi:hypothetical protein FB446DRAFT_411347 [Lentinula raphanica]|nr:hypothetical protein FB446DRAFT_411347 [Lentinula raphanica]
MDLEPEELQMPPKSVVVRLTKVEVQKLVATPSISQNMADSKTRSVPKAREWQNNKDMDKKTDAMDKVRNDSNERDSAQMTQVQDPRFLVQSADIPRKYATIDPSFLLKRNTNSTTHKNHERRFSAVVSANHSQRDTAMSTQSTVPNATIQGRKRSSDHGKLTHDRSKVVKASISQPILNPGSEPAKHSSMRPAYRESVSYPGASVLKISDDAGLTDLSPAPAPPLPPRRSQPDAIKDIGGQISQQIAGPSTSKSADRSGNDDQPPSYDELSVEEGYTSGMKEKKGRDKS